MTQLIEFKNQDGEVLRGLLDRAKSRRGVIFVHGFERTSVEKRFKVIIDRLKNKINFLRFDLADCGLSDGNFKNFTVDKSAQELATAVKVFMRHSKFKDLIIVAHSVGGCISLRYLLKYAQSKASINKLILFAPALNQHELLRYWFVQAKAPQKKINWKNYKKFLNEKAFREWVKLKKRVAKAHVLNNQYFLENYQLDYNSYLGALGERYKILVVHGDQDEKVPIASNSFKKVLKIKGGDHDLQRPDMVKQWLNPVINFIQDK